MRARPIASILLLLTTASMTPVLAPAAVAQDSSAVTGFGPADRARLAEAFRLADELGDELWPGWSRAPFAVLLVTPEREFLIRHPAPPPGFARYGYDSTLRADVFARTRVFQVNLLATFPIGGPLPVIVIGKPELTGKTTTAWILTLLHEHFHQLQFSRPGYYPGLNALGLARGDTTGMWALNYAFPYTSRAIGDRFDTLTASLARALASGSAPDSAHVSAVARARIALAATLAAEDARYLEFQLWQEGVARYTEYKLAALAAERFTPSPAVRALPDFQPWAAARDSLRLRIVRGTSMARLDSHGREVAYPVGAALALALDTARPSWRAEYLERMFALPAIEVKD
jgi:hypothetical protein